MQYAGNLYCPDNCGLYPTQEFLDYVNMFVAMFGAEFSAITGARCPNYEHAHNRPGTSQHCHRVAVDGKVIKGNLVLSTKVLSYLAQIYGFTGVANNDDKYSSIHLDRGLRSQPYYGNEIVNLNSVTANFKNYYGLTMKDILTPFVVPPVTVGKDRTVSGVWAKSVQCVLKIKGYAVGNVDGDFGPKSMAALKQFQHDCGLVEDMQAGPKTYARLYAA